MNPDEQTIEERAKAFLTAEYTHVDGWISDGWPERMADFARSELTRDSRLRDAEEVIDGVADCDMESRCYVCPRIAREYRRKYPKV